jgi:hypothetical protein
MTIALWSFPALIIGRATDSAFGFYFGAALQIVIGAWIVIWFHPYKSPNEKGAA